MPKSKNRRKPKSSAGAKAQSRPEEQASGTASESATIAGEATEPQAKAKSVGPLQFFRQVRDEGQKITWTTRNETMVSTIMVLIMVALASLFFFLVDQVLRTVIPLILSINL